MNRKTNILYIYHVSSVGGGSFCLLNMIKKLDKQFFNPIILLKETGPLCSELEKLGATVHIEKLISTVPYNNSIYKLNSIKQLILMFLSLIKIKNWIKKTNAEIVHINTMMMYPYLIPSSQLKKKVIIHIREHWPKDEHKFQLLIARKIIKKYSTKIIAINEFSANMIGSCKKTHIIYDWIDFENRDENVDLSKLFGENYKSYKIFLFLGGTHTIKGSLEVVDTFSTKILDKDVRLLLVGCDKKGLDYTGIKGQIKRYLSFFNIYTYIHQVKITALKDNRIVFIPSTYQVKSLIEQCYCVVSFFTIPHANLLIAESIWLGKPSISIDTPEAKEYSNDGKATLLFKMNNKVEFEKAILFSLENEKLINDNAISGMKYIQYKFDPIRNSVLLNKIYSDIII